MLKLAHFCFACLVILLLAATSTQAADVVLQNGKIITVDTDFRVVQAIHPGEALSREQMIRFYTINNAWLMRAEHEIGSLEMGKRADFCVVDRDLLGCPEEQIRDTKVLETWLDGERLFAADR